jgi:1-acyl-sn-glycerol-3-phosphate acyltransferase
VREMGVRRRRVGLRELGPWYVLALVVLKPLALLLTRTRWRGVEHVPEHGGVVLAANHISWVDPVVLADYVVFGAGRPARFLAKRSLFRGRGLVGRVMRGAGQIPVDRGTANASTALADAVAALRAGECVVLYPEGTVTRDPDKWPMAAKTGVVRLALLSGAPVVPVGQWGAQRLHDSYRGGSVRLLPPSPVTVVAGPEVDLSAYRGREMTVEVLREATDEVMTAVRRLVEQARGQAAPALVHRP